MWHEGFWAFRIVSPQKAPDLVPQWGFVLCLAENLVFGRDSVPPRLNNRLELLTVVSNIHFISNLTRHYFVGEDVCTNSSK